jgi:hypothetical protein
MALRLNLLCLPGFHPISEQQRLSPHYTSLSIPK